ncbi:phosphotransferase enzyme family protein [Cryptosporangium sp. NPDC048952]|uniref:phosphotransferase enzyme family protein n=1 Tax=Cryptosporangium sp. NPDC048952 TaxID=3363961 RepID=UPI00371EF65D
MPADDQDQLLREALATVAGQGWSSAPYRFSAIGGGTQANVWRGHPTRPDAPEVAVRLTPKPAELIGRIAGLVNAIDSLERPETLAVASLESTTGRRGTVHVCTWIGAGSANRRDPHGLGQAIARLHDEMARGGTEFADRRLSFERGPIPAADQELPAWFVARHLWRDRILPRFVDADSSALRMQPIHGDLHFDNVVTGSGGAAFGFIDFDKLMFAPPVFDLAKLLATGFFRVVGETGSVRFQRTHAIELLGGYQSIRPLTDAEIAAIEGFAVILNEEIARLGHVYDVAGYRAQADAVGGWWSNRRRRNPSDPLGIRTATASPDPRATTTPEQLTFL